MESCNICCFPYSDSTSEGSSSKVEKNLACGHSLCHSCYLRLDKTYCPFCRSVFNYSNQELEERKLLNLNYHNWQPPSQIYNYIPPSNNISSFRNRTRNRVISVEDLNAQINPNQNRDNRNPNIIQEPFSRVRKNMIRKRRKDLEFEEVLERRKIIRKRCQKKWVRKNSRVEKELSYFTNGMIIN